MIIPLTAQATIQDLINIYEEEQALELSQLCDELAANRDDVKLQAALDNALSIINGYYLTSSDCGKALIKTAGKQLQLWLAVYIADTIKSRPFVEEGYNKAMEMLKYACTECVDRCPLNRAELETILGEGVSRRSRLRCYSGRRTRIAERTEIHPAFKSRLDNYFVNYYNSVYYP